MPLGWWGGGYFTVHSVTHWAVERCKLTLHITVQSVKLPCSLCHLSVYKQTRTEYVSPNMETEKLEEEISEKLSQCHVRHLCV